MSTRSILHCPRTPEINWCAQSTEIPVTLHYRHQVKMFYLCFKFFTFTKKAHITQSLGEESSYCSEIFIVFYLVLKKKYLFNIPDIDLGYMSSICEKINIFLYI